MRMGVRYFVVKSVERAVKTTFSSKTGGSWANDCHKKQVNTIAENILENISINNIVRCKDNENDHREQYTTKNT